jgi:replicative DNA helicase
MSNLRIPPQAVEVETHVLGAMMLSRDAALEGIELLADTDFYLNRNGVIFAAIKEITLNSGNPDALTVMDHLKKSGKEAQAGGEGTLLEISCEVVSSASVRDHAAIVRDKAVLRLLADFSGQVAEYAYSARADAAKGLEMAFTGIMGMNGRDTAGGLVDWRDGVRATVERWGKIAAGQAQGVLTGLTDYDALIGGFLPSQLHVLGGRPGMGKSALILQIAKKAGRTAIFSLESLMHEQVERAMAQEAGLKGDVFRSPDLLNMNKAKIEAAVASIAGYPIKVNDTTSIDAGQIHSQCRKMKAKDGLDMVVVDYLQLVKAVGKHERREREIGSISESLKRMANDLSVPVIAVASLSRDCERREDKRPVLSDLRESGSLESDAHTVTYLYREGYYNRKMPDVYKDIAEIAVRKNKNGPTGVAPFLFEGARFRFVDLERNAKEQYKLFIGGGADSASFMEGVNTK